MLSNALLKKYFDMILKNFKSRFEMMRKVQ